MKISKLTPFISILIPTFNDASFLKECLESVEKQSLNNIEIICIDDGSTDNTCKILKGFALKDNRFKIVIKPKNEGVSMARNEALKLATGKYFTFIDGDDLMDEFLLEKAYNLAETTCSDMVLWDYITFSNSNEILKEKIMESNLKYISPKDKIFLLKRPAFSWMKLVNTNIARNMGVHFPNGLIREDIPMHWHLITSIKEIAILPERLSFYRQNTLSLTHKKNSTVLDIAPVMDIVEVYLRKNKMYQEYKYEFLRQQLNLLYGMQDFIAQSFKKEAFNIINKKMGKDQWEYVYTNKPLRQQARWFYKSKDGDFISLIKYQSWKLVRLLYRKFN